MSAQQIKLNINDLVNQIEDENKLQACFTVLVSIANDTKKEAKRKATKPRLAKKNKATTSQIKQVNDRVPHDLSLVLLANDLFKGSKTLSEEENLAFDDVLKASALKIPTLPNRL